MYSRCKDLRMRRLSKSARACPPHRSEERAAVMAYGDPNDFGWCNLVVKFLLFVTNVIVWVSVCREHVTGSSVVFCCPLQLCGIALLGAGIYALTAPETNLDDLDVGDFLTTPAIFLVIIGGLLFILGFCGCFGALLEIGRAHV